jgi:hypothetical protein
MVTSNIQTLYSKTRTIILGNTTCTLHKSERLTIWSGPAYLGVSLSYTRYVTAILSPLWLGSDTRHRITSIFSFPTTTSDCRKWRGRPKTVWGLQMLCA